MALTLLVLDLQASELDRPSDAALQQGLLAVLPSALTFVLSFVVVGLYWLSHHRLFQIIRAQDRGLLYANLLFLLTVCFIPFPTSILGR